MEKKKKESIKLKRKLARLISILKKMQAVLIAYSGGADSSLLLRIAKETLGDNVTAVTADSPLYSQEELKFTRTITERWGIRHKVIKIPHLENSQFVRNPVSRCYYCKRDLFKRLWNIAKISKIKYVLDGSNADDSKDFRPGIQAKKELGVRSPLEECGINKQDIYQLSRLYHLPTRNKPATVCFASRIPYGQPISSKDLEMIKQAERYIRGLGFKQVRLRHYSLGQAIGASQMGYPLKRSRLKLARLEVDKCDIPQLINRRRNSVTCYLKRLGYDYVTLDLEGYRPGSLNK